MRRIGVAASVLAVCVALVAAPVVAQAHGPALSWSPTTSAGAFDFGDLVYPQGQPPAEAGQTFTLTNSGSRIGSVAISLSGDSEFSIGADTCTGTALRKGASCWVWVVFQGLTGGSAVLSIAGKNPPASASITITVDSVTELITVPPTTPPAP